MLVVGAGPTGLGAALALREADRSDWLLLEAEPYAGGLSASFRDEAGFTWDLGGHVLHSGYDAFREFCAALLPGDGLQHHRRRAFVRFGGGWVPYPFQNNLHRLPEPARSECLAGLAAAATDRGTAPDANFGQWVERCFGPGIAEHFMRPYNRKLWCCELSELSAGWVAARVSRPDPARLAASAAADRDDDDFGMNREFSFPRSGGTGELWRRSAARLPAENLRFATRVEALDLDRRVARTASGEEIGYEHLIWTGPLDVLARCCARPDLTAAAAELHHNSVEVFGLGLAGAPPRDVAAMHWTYHPGPGCPFYRATVFSGYAPDNVPAPGECWSLMLEVARRPGWPCRIDELWPRVMQATVDEGLLSEEAGVISRWHRTVPHAYPLPAVGRDAALARLVPGLEAAGVLPRGRFGAWRYEVGNMDHCFLQGRQAAARLLSGAPETVLAGGGQA